MGIEWVGPIQATGSYILHLALSDPIKSVIGGLGKQTLQPGDYCYVGSAQGIYANSLPYRLLRHCITTTLQTRQIYHKLSTELISHKLIRGDFFPKKSLHWHIDYLLEQVKIEITDILIITKEDWSETLLVGLLEDLGYEQPIRGMGSSDSHAFAHFFRLYSGNWDEIRSAISGDG